MKSLDIVGNNGDPYEVFPLSECQGDCDSNDECIGNLYAYNEMQEISFQDVSVATTIVRRTTAFDLQY